MENSDSKKEKLQLLIESANSLDAEQLRCKVIEYIIRNQFLENTIEQLKVKVQSGVDMISRLVCKEAKHKAYVVHVKSLLAQHTEYENIVGKEMEDISEIINVSEQRRCEYEMRFENISQQQTESAAQIGEIVEKCKFFIHKNNNGMFIYIFC